jgi:MscS family membrane protein
MIRCVLALALLGAPASGAGQAGDTARVDPRSPRAAVETFLRTARGGDFDAAARVLGDGGSADLARKLKAVLDRHLWIELDLVSLAAAGDTADGLAPNLEQLGAVPNAAGVREPVLLRRRAAGADPSWVFDGRTVSRVDDWYAALDDIWLRSRMPSALQRTGPLGFEWWQWLMLGVLVPVALGAGWIAGRLTISVARRVSRRTKTTLDDRLLDRIWLPLIAIWSVVAYRLLVDAIALSMGAEQLVSLLARVFTAALVTWLVIRTTLVLEAELPSSSWGQSRPELRALLPLAGRIARIALFSVGAIVIVAQFGYNVTTLVAGLGIGGIALALAAQKTLEHGFGSIAIGIDRPIRIGDWVKVDTAEGEVEHIGLRSTRIRTLARSLVVIPNGRLADMQMENFGVRDRMLLRTQISLEYGATVEQVKQVRDGIERVLADHPLVWDERIVVRFFRFGPSSLDIDVIAWIVTSDMNVFRAAREEIFFRFMEVVQGTGCSFAFPTQTINLRQ